VFGTAAAAAVAALVALQVKYRRVIVRIMKESHYSRGVVVMIDIFLYVERRDQIVVVVVVT